MGFKRSGVVQLTQNILTALLSGMVIYLICGWNSCTKTKRRKQLVTAKAIQVLISKGFSEIIIFLLLLTLKNLCNLYRMPFLIRFYIWPF